MPTTRRGATALRCALLVAVATGLTGCTGADGDGGPRDGPTGSPAGGTLVYYLGSALDTLDPQRLYTGRDISNLGRTVYRSLVSYPASGDPEVGTTPVPDLATDTGTSTDGGRVWSFEIKDGVRWEDGRPIGCEDFRYGASRAFATDVVTGGPHYLLGYLDVPLDPATGLSAYGGPYTRRGQELFDRAVTCGGKTITYHFKKPWPDFPLAVASLHLADPYRRDQDRGAGSKYRVFSNGPYRLDGAWSNEAGGTLVRSESYDPATDSPSLRRALPDRIELRIGLTPEVQYDRLLADRGVDRYAVSGDAAPPSRYREIGESAAARSLLAEAPYVVYLAPHFRSPHLGDRVVRRAFALATDADGCVTALGGATAGHVAESIVHPLVPGYRPNPAFAGSDSGDPGAARRMLTAAGVDLPVRITLAYATSQTADKCAAALQDTWGRAGFAVTLDPESWGGITAVQENPEKDTDVLMLVWGADWPSAMTVTPPLFDSRVNLTPTSDGQDAGAYDSAAFNDLVDAAEAAPDPGARVDALRRADLRLGEDVAYVPLLAVRFLLLHGSRVTHYVVTPGSSGYPDLGPIGVAP